VSHPEPQEQPSRAPQDPYPYGPETAGSPWPGPGPGSEPRPAADQQPPSGGWGPSSDPWPDSPRDAVPARYGHGGGDQGWQDQPGTRYDGGTPAAGGLPTSTVVLLVVSGLGVLTGFATLAGVPALILAIIAATSASTDRERAERLTRTGWIVFAAVVVGTILLVVLGLVLLLAVGGGLASGAFAGF